MPDCCDQDKTLDLDLPIGLVLGMLAGAAVGILFAPKAGQALQSDIQSFVHQLPEDLQDGLSRSKVRYRELMGKTRQGIETKLEQRAERRRARRMAKAKFMEESDSGVCEY